MNDLRALCDEIKQRVSMAEALSLYGLSYSGKRIPCPIHGGKGDNFSVKNGAFRCFTCGAHGTVIDFVMQMDGLTLSEAANKLAEAFGIAVRANTPAERKARQRGILARLKAKKERYERERASRKSLDRLCAARERLEALSPFGAETPLSWEYRDAVIEYEDALGEVEADERERREQLRAKG